MSETKELLEATVKGLQEKIGQLNMDLKNKQQDLEDANKLVISSEVMNVVNDAINYAVENYDFDNRDQYEIEYGIDYDGKVHCENFEFNDSYELIDAVVKKVSSLFAEATCPEDEEPINKQLEQPVESQPVEEEVLLDPMPPAEPCESEVTHSKPSTEDMESLNKMAEEKKQNKEEKTFKKRSWFN